MKLLILIFTVMITGAAKGQTDTTKFRKLTDSTILYYGKTIPVSLPDNFIIDSSGIRILRKGEKRNKYGLLTNSKNQ